MDNLMYELLFILSVYVFNKHIIDNRCAALHMPYSASAQCLCSSHGFGLNALHHAPVFFFLLLQWSTPVSLPNRCRC
jgi:hypothetical protein